jgi:Domain of unknown function (DUF1707)/Cell wall-active antibiotics response 4TMS YvqF
MEPASGAQRIRVSDAEREAVVARLNAATGEGRLTLEEFTDRAGRAYAARTQGELARLVDDLPATSAGVPASASPRRRWLVSPIGSVKRSGRWRLEGDTGLITGVGSVKLDLGDAVLGAPEASLTVVSAVGSVKVWIPRGARVEVTGLSILGSRRVQENADTDYRDAPVLRLRIFSGVGSVRIYRR